MQVNLLGNAVAQNLQFWVMQSAVILILLILMNAFRNDIYLAHSCSLHFHGLLGSLFPEFKGKGLKFSHVELWPLCIMSSSRSCSVVTAEQNVMEWMDSGVLDVSLQCLICGHHRIWGVFMLLLFTSVMSFLFGLEQQAIAPDIY